MRIVSFNANGLRASARKGFFDWFADNDVDVLCVQETKAQTPQLMVPEYLPDGYHAHFRDATTKKGYSGVAIYCRERPDEVRTELGWADFDEEGRYIEARFGNLSVVSFYIPSGTSGEERQDYKYRVMEWLKPIFDEWLASGRDYVLCGDWNIVRSERDIKNWKSNQKNSGFLPEERAWLSRVFDELGYVDVYRQLYPDAGDACYTWWSNRGQAWAKNVGWRLDYQIATPGVAASARRAAVFKDLRFSDHAPLTIDYDWTI